jgi:L-asparaginase/Glu-tRNA(Gln) amidotransferase subunit D
VTPDRDEGSPSPAGGGTAQDTGDQLVSRSRSGGDVDVRVEDVLCVGSWPMTLERMPLGAVRDADQLADPDVSELVVTHGTDTTER